MTLLVTSTAAWQPNGDTITNIVIGALNLTMAGAQLIIGYLTYRISQKTTFHEPYSGYEVYRMNAVRRQHR
ncbi:hypothetical protein BU23DRAFT_549944 [Bimuria novae-zelandiae CBS 107.79]|uniref:Uncharacterized protein n=1 Tax=Bimuria novae-zelandiae CBS 107.79 TaxID=1447943 RepID=A0A6A5VZE6_9PLEO|nr:hypothetical protein BU23DRAFT_549944 [Bimuria novae-zelandiae CBS 107.79]